MEYVICIFHDSLEADKGEINTSGRSGELFVGGIDCAFCIQCYNSLTIIFHAMPPSEKFIDIPRWISLGSCHHCNKTRQRYVHSRHLFCHIIIGEENIIVCCCYCKNILKFNTYQNYRNLFIVFSHYFTQSNYEKTLLINSFFNFLFVLKYEMLFTYCMLVPTRIIIWNLFWITGVWFIWYSMHSLSSSCDLQFNYIKLITNVLIFEIRYKLSLNTFY